MALRWEMLLSPGMVMSVTMEPQRRIEKVVIGEALVVGKKMVIGEGQADSLFSCPCEYVEHGVVVLLFKIFGEGAQKVGHFPQGCNRCV